MQSGRKTRRQQQPVPPPDLVRTSAALPRMADRPGPVAVSAVAMEVEPIAIVVVRATRFLPLVVPPVVSTAVAAIIAGLLATVLSAVVAVGVSESSVVAVAGDLAVFQVGAATADLVVVVGTVLVLLALILFDELSKDLLQALSRYLGFVDRPDRREELPAQVVSNRTKDGKGRALTRTVAPGCPEQWSPPSADS